MPVHAFLINATCLEDFVKPRWKHESGFCGKSAGFQNNSECIGQLEILANRPFKCFSASASFRCQPILIRRLGVPLTKFIPDNYQAWSLEKTCSLHILWNIARSATLINNGLGRLWKHSLSESPKVWLIAYERHLEDCLNYLINSPCIRLCCVSPTLGHNHHYHNLHSRHSFFFRKPFQKEKASLLWVQSADTKSICWWRSNDRGPPKTGGID